MIKASDFTRLADAISDESEHGGSAAGGDDQIGSEIVHACELILAKLSLPIPSPDSLERAQDWHNDMDKELMVQRVAEWGVDLMRDERRMIPTWADVAMYVYAARLTAGLPVRPE